MVITCYIGFGIFDISRIILFSICSVFYILLSFVIAYSGSFINLGNNISIRDFILLSENFPCCRFGAGLLFAYGIIIKCLIDIVIISFKK